MHRCEPLLTHVSATKPETIVGTVAPRRACAPFSAVTPRRSWKLTLAEVAREIGVSRQMAFMMLPGWTAKRQRLCEQRVRAFARKHPAPTLSAALQTEPRCADLEFVAIIVAANPRV